MLNTLKKLKNTFNEIKIINSKQPLFRVVGVNEDLDGKPIFDVQLIGKNICMRHTQEELLNDLHIFQNLSECERVIVKEYGRTLQDVKPYKTSNNKNIKVLNFKRNYIKSYSIDPITQKTVFYIGVEGDGVEETYLMQASEIMKNPKLFLIMNPNDKTQIAYHAGMEDVIEENKYLKRFITNPTSSLKSIFNFFTKKKG